MNSENPFVSPSEGSGSPDFRQSELLNLMPFFHIAAALLIPVVLARIVLLANPGYAADPTAVFPVSALILGLLIGVFVSRCRLRKAPFAVVFVAYFVGNIASLLIWNIMSLLWIVGGLGILVATIYAAISALGELVGSYFARFLPNNNQ